MTMNDRSNDRRMRRRRRRGEEDDVSSLSPAFLVRLARPSERGARDEENANDDDDVKSNGDSNDESATRTDQALSREEDNEEDSSVERRSSSSSSSSSRSDGSKNNPNQLADFLARILGQQKPNRTETEEAPPDAKKAADDVPPLRRTYADFALLDRRLRSELAEEDYTALPRLPLEPPPSPPPSQFASPSTMATPLTTNMSKTPRKSESDLLAVERDADAARTASELGRYLSAAVGARGAVRSDALREFLSTPSASSASASAAAEEEGGERSYIDYLLPPWSDSSADGSSGDGDYDGDTFDVIPPQGSFVREVTVPRGWHVVWRFAVLPGGEERRGSRSRSNSGASTPDGGRMLASALGLEGVDFKLALQEAASSDKEEEEGAKDIEMSTVTGPPPGDESLCSQDNCAPSAASTVVTVGTEGTSLQSLPTLDVASGRVVRDQKVLLSDRRFDVICGSYRLHPDDCDEGDDGDNHESRPESIARLVFTHLGGEGGARRGRNHRRLRRLIRLDAAAVPCDAYEAAVRAAADQNASDEKYRRAPMLRAIVEGMAGKGGGRRVAEEGNEGDNDDDASSSRDDAIRLVVVPAGADKHEGEGDDDGAHDEDEKESAEGDGDDEKKTDLEEVAQLCKVASSGRESDGRVSDESIDKDIELREQLSEGDTESDTEGEGEGESVGAASSPAATSVKPDAIPKALELTEIPPSSSTNDPLSIQEDNPKTTSAADGAAPAENSAETADSSTLKDDDNDDAGHKDEAAATTAALIGRLREELDSLKSSASRSEAVLLRELSALRASAVARSEEERAARAELHRLRAELAEERGSDRARAEALEAAREEVRALRAELDGARRERRRRRTERTEERRREEELGRRLREMTSQNRRLEARLIEEKARLEAEARRAVAERDRALKERRTLEGRVRNLEEREQRGGGRSRRWGGGRLRQSSFDSSAASVVSANTTRTLDSDLVHDEEFVLFHAHHPNAELNEQLVKLRRRHRQLSASLKQDPRQPNAKKNAELIKKIEESVAMIVQTAPATAQ